ncbi:MAG: acyl-CoA dehydrogenase family protein [Patulibacter sp.]|nr:acyl-CoA dehydrogenase family protein [Patulibacter sp.]
MGEGALAAAGQPPLRGSGIDPDAGLVPVLRTHADAVAAAHEYAEAIRPGTAERERAGGVPWTELERLGRSGLTAIGVPSAYDGPELGFSTIAEVVRVIAAVDPAIAQQLQPNFMFSLLLWELGHADGAARIAQVLLSGGRVANAAAERGGAHAQDLRTRLLRAPDGTLRLHGTKYYCTGAISSDWIAVTAIDDSPDERQQLVFVARGAAGVELDDDWAAMGQRNTVSGTSRFTDVLVDPALAVPYWQAFADPQAIGARGQSIHAAIEVGIAGGALRDAGEFLREKSRPFFEAARGGWAERAADDPHTIYRFGQLSTKVAAAEALLRDATAVVDRTPTRPADPDEAAAASVAVARAKAFGSEVAVEVASELFAITGTSATDEKYNLNRHWRNARTHSVHDPVSWKYHHIGAYDVSGTLPPSHGQL